MISASFCQVFSRRVEAQGSSEFHQCVVTPSFHVLSLIANQEIAKTLVVHNPSNGESLTVF